MSVVNALVEIFQESGFLSLEWQNWVMMAVSFLLCYCKKIRAVTVVTDCVRYVARQHLPRHYV